MVHVPAALWALLAVGSPPSATSPPDPVTFISDPAALAVIEANGGALGERLTGAAAANNEALARSPELASVVEVIEADLEEARRTDPKAGVGMKFAHRLFDARWLRAPWARFELIGVANRIDRRVFHPGTCGEVRFIYRLGYAKPTARGQVASRLPMTINLVFWQLPEAGGCSAVARRWLAPAGAAGDRLAAWSLDAAGPLRVATLSRARLKSLEINLQSARWPSAVRPDLGGHAEYLLRVFHPSATGGAGRRLEAAPLENVPDVARLRADPRLRAELAAWLADEKHAAAVDDGTAVIPEKFVARRAISVAPRGMARLANRPFSQLFGDAPLGALRARHLDELSCMGCHQSRSVAGFHFLGVEPNPGKEVDAIAVAMSPHLHDEIGRRAHYLLTLAAGGATDERRPFAERGARAGDYGSHCGLTPAFAAWTCDPGLRCVAVDEPDVGICLAAKPEVGDPCEPGRVSSNADAHRDRRTPGATRACAADQVCEATSVGFPGGMCAARCGEGGPQGACGAIALLTPFNNCVARGEPFEACVRANVRPAELRGCDFKHPCRDDYVCTRGEKGRGTCIPPYFLFQMRVDGHPAADARRP
jgi:hypothetical protein